jgi:hypothetical protein
MNEILSEKQKEIIKKIKDIKQIKFGGEIFLIEYIKLTQDNCHAFCDHFKNVISIREDICNIKLPNTLLHEILHLSLDFFENSEFHDDDTIKKLSFILVNLLKENKILFKLLIEFLE